MFIGRPDLSNLAQPSDIKNSDFNALIHFINLGPLYRFLRLFATIRASETIFSPFLAILRLFVKKPSANPGRLALVGRLTQLEEGKGKNYLKYLFDSIIQLLIPNSHIHRIK